MNARTWFAVLVLVLGTGAVALSSAQEFGVDSTTTLGVLSTSTVTVTAAERLDGWYSLPFDAKGGGLELKAHAERQAYEKQVFADNYTDLDLIFAGTTGQPLCNSNLLQTYLRPLLAEAGLNPKVTLYTLRHTHATLLLIAGVHPKVVAERLGHSSIKLTLDVYSHVMPGMQQSAIEKLDTLLRPTPSKDAAPVQNQPEKST